MYCKSCGKQIDNDSLFCSFCGIKQKTSESIKDNRIEDTATLYDLTYKREENALIVGINLLVISLIFAIGGPIQLKNTEFFGQFIAALSIISLVIRCIIPVWVVNIASRQNRDTYLWGILALVLPSVTLIIISTRKKLLTA